MVSEERLIWLLGPDRPARVIPVGLVPAPNEKVANEEHHPLAHPSLGPPQPADDHPHALPNATHHNHLVTYPHDPGQEEPHQVLVSVPHGERHEDHLPKMSICIRAAQPGEKAAGIAARPIHLIKFVEEAVATVKGSSLWDLWKAAGDDPPRNIEGLLGDEVGDVHRVATEALAMGLEELTAARVIDSEDLDALDPASLIGELLTAPREREALNRDSAAVVVTLIHPPGVDHVHFSLKIEGGK